MIKRTLMAAGRALGIVPAHETVNRFTEYEVYPPHPKREESDEYRRNHRRLVEEDRRPCFFCGKTLNEAREAGYALETHHWFEYSLWEALDPERVKRDLERLDFYGYGRELADRPIETPDDIRNLVVLCSACHREAGYGIHHATIPFVWARRALRDPKRDVLKRVRPLGGEGRRKRVSLKEWFRKGTNRRG